MHRAFLEYLAAADICDRFAAHDITAEDLSGVFTRHWADPAWHEVLVLIAGMIPSRFTGTVISALLQADAAWPLRTRALPAHLLLALRCLGEARKPGEVAAQSRAVAAELILLLNAWGADEFFNETSPDVIRTFASGALTVLARLGPHWAGRRIFEDWYLASGQFIPGDFSGSGASYTAARMYFALLGQVPQTSHAIIRWHAEQSTARDVRRAAVEAVAAGWRDDPGTLGLLRDRAVTDLSDYVRRAAVGAVAAGWRDDPATLALLHDRATADQHEYVRQAATEALAAGRQDDLEPQMLLRDRASTDPLASLF